MQSWEKLAKSRLPPESQARRLQDFKSKQKLWTKMFGSFANQVDLARWLPPNPNPNPNQVDLATSTVDVDLAAIEVRGGILAEPASRL